MRQRSNDQGETQKLFVNNIHLMVCYYKAKIRYVYFFVKVGWQHTLVEWDIPRLSKSSPQCQIDFG